MKILSFNGFTPVIKENVFIADGCIITGNAVIEKNASVWFNTVLRADMDKISIGENTNIQDNSVLHCDENTPLSIGSNVTIGHNCVVHGCTIEGNVLIGMGSVIMNNAVIKQGSVIAAGSVILENTDVPEFCVFAGTPAKKKKDLDESVLELIKKSAAHYTDLKNKYLEIYKNE